MGEGLRLMVSISIWAGIGFYIAKFLVMWMTVSSLDKMFPSMKLSYRSHHSLWWLVIVDGIFGYLGSHVFNATNMGMLSLVAFTVCSFIYIGGTLIVNKLISWWQSYKKGDKEIKEVRKESNSDTQTSNRTRSSFRDTWNATS